MRKFSIYIVSGVLSIVVILLVLDLVYTKVYENSYPRTKFQYFRSLKNKKTDYIFIGSSRVENGIVPAVIYQKTRKNAVNLGFQAARLSDIYTILQLVKNYNIQYETIFIQVDYNFNMSGHSNIFQNEMMPFVRENKITKQYNYSYAESPCAIYYVPFYRYCNNDLKIGFREIFANLVNKKTSVVPNKGYGAIYGNSNILKGALLAKIIDKNDVFDSVQSFVKQNKMRVKFFCAPFCKDNENKDYTTKLKAKIPGLLDFSRLIDDDTMFVNCNHLNDSGAKRFTAIFAKQVLMK
jgi:hypothetical protein